MARDNEKLNALLQAPFACPVYYFASTEEAMLKEAAAKVRAAVLAAPEGADVTVLEGPAPDVAEVVAAAGTISFFGTPRLVELRTLSLPAVKDADAEELAALFGEMENAVLLVTVLHKDKKAAGTKKAKALFAAAEKAGYAAEIAKPTRRDNLQYIAQLAGAAGASISPAAAEALLLRAGEDRTLLQQEVAKLAALCAYGAIGEEAVEALATHNVEADVFQLVGAIAAGRAAAAHQKLAQLLALRQEPVAIAGALAGSFVDMYRVRVGVEAKKPLSTIFKDMGYKGNEYRMQKAKENAARYTTAALQGCILCLAKLDRQLKSSALPDKSLLLQAAVGQLLLLRGR
ncbi:DNA polymerase III subunit delta [Ruminococcaceae bacterium OttesenSCG-928-O06]|nr:DNA polymerase III subunit delta [Ruminococcaceae bacterium OttesenSCG-928-O06]